MSGHCKWSGICTACSVTSYHKHVATTMKSWKHNMNKNKVSAQSICSNLHSWWCSTNLWSTHPRAEFTFMSVSDCHLHAGQLTDELIQSLHCYLGEISAATDRYCGRSHIPVWLVAQKHNVALCHTLWPYLLSMSNSLRFWPAPRASRLPFRMAPRLASRLAALDANRNSPAAAETKCLFRVHTCK